MIQWSSRFYIHLHILSLKHTCRHVRSSHTFVKYNFVFNNFQVSGYSFCFSSRCFTLNCSCWFIVQSLCHPFKVFFIGTFFQSSIDCLLCSFSSSYHLSDSSQSLNSVGNQKEALDLVNLLFSFANSDYLNIFNQSHTFLVVLLISKGFLLRDAAVHSLNSSTLAKLGVLK